jgi:hypothetical protein
MGLRPSPAKSQQPNRADLAISDHGPVIGEAKWGASPAIQATDFLAGGLTMESARGQFAGLMA